MTSPCTSCGVADPFMYPCNQQGCPHQHPEAATEPCPYCFESSGFEARYIPATWYEPAWEDTDYSRPCEHCNGTGVFERRAPAATAQTAEEEMPF